MVLEAFGAPFSESGSVFGGNFRPSWGRNGRRWDLVHSKLRPRWTIKKPKRVTRIDFFRWEWIRCTKDEKRRTKTDFPRVVWARKFDPSKAQKKLFYSRVASKSRKLSTWLAENFLSAIGTMRFVRNCGPEGSKLKEIWASKCSNLGKSQSGRVLETLGVPFSETGLRAKWSKMGSSSLQVASKMDHKEGKKGD